MQGLNGEESQHHHKETNITGLQIVKFQWHHVETPYLVILWVFVAGVAKLSGMQL